MATPLSGPGKLTFDANNALLVTNSGGGGSTNVNIADINGSPPSMSNPLPVELSDGTNPLGTTTNPVNENIAKFGGTVTSLGQKTSASSIPVVLASDQTEPPSVVSAANSTTTPLAANGVFTGTSESVLGFTGIAVSSFSNVASAAAGLPRGRRPLRRRPASGR